MNAAPEPDFQRHVQGPDLDRRGNRWIGAGGAFGLAGSIAAILLPIALVEGARYAPGGFVPTGATLVAWSTDLVLAGGVLLYLSFFSYDWGYYTLRKVAGRYSTAYGLCLVGSTGLILLIVAAVIARGSEAGLVACFQGSYGQLLSCAQSRIPFGADAGLVGIWLVWIGNVGIVLGLFLSGHRFRSGSYMAAAVCYLLVLALLAGPLVGLLYPGAYVEPFLLAAPVFALAAPLLVLLARPTYPVTSASSSPQR
jgi:hypothetical protein